MKLKQIALAAAVVAAAGSAAAQMADAAKTQPLPAQRMGAEFGSGVSVYGIVDVNVNNAKTETGFDSSTAATAAAASTAQGRLGSGGLSTSRVGFKGTEDLGGGLSASFQLEGKLSVDTGENANYDRPAGETSANYFFGRQSWVGLSGNFGTLQLGKTWTSFDDVKGKFEHADNTNVGVTADVWGTGALCDNNKPNQLKYTLPAMGGLTASIGYAFGEDKTASDSAKDTTSLNVTYDNGGPFAVGYGYQTEGQNTAGVKDSKFHVLGASYDLGAAKLVAAWSQSSYNTGSLGGQPNVTKTIGSGVGTASDAKDKEYQLGVKFPIGASNLYFGYADSKVDVGGAERANASGYVLAATYSLSKRTTAYVGYTNAKRTRNVGIAGSETSGRKTNATFGVRHVF